MSDFSFAGTCVCGKQSLGLLFCRRPRLQPQGSSPVPAILFPKLRMQFAEFLNEGFPAHLRILSLPACVGFGTGAVRLARSFSRQCGPLGFGSPKGLPPCHVSAFTRGICLPCSLPASTRSSIRAPKLPPASLHHSNDSLRYWNVCQLSIAYACCLGLGPD